ncbi:MAG: PPK2 family polyphosphate kinase [Pseudomonadota bacterium]
MSDVFDAVDSPWLAPTDGSFQLADFATVHDSGASKSKLKDRLGDEVDRIAELQEQLYADNRFSLLLVFQAMDAAGKDSTIQKVLSGVNPAGCQVTSFKRPSSKELEHDFLWRTTVALPERGRIGVFNRSHYEEVLVVRVHPGILKSQNLPDPTPSASLWRQRLDAIAAQERHLANNGTVILKFFLNVSEDEQRERFIDRLEEPDKRWKFSAGDLAERAHWPKYMAAYEEAIRATSKPWAPWYVIPADDKPTMRWLVAAIVAERLSALPLQWPQPDADDARDFETHLATLKAQRP